MENPKRKKDKNMEKKFSFGGIRTHDLLKSRYCWQGNRWNRAKEGSESNSENGCTEKTSPTHRTSNNGSECVHHFLPRCILAWAPCILGSKNRKVPAPKWVWVKNGKRYPGSTGDTVDQRCFLGTRPTMVKVLPFQTTFLSFLNSSPVKTSFFFSQLLRLEANLVKNAVFSRMVGLAPRKHPW